MEFIKANAGTILVGALVFAVLAFAAIRLIVKARRGKGCGCGCGGCPGCGS
jgi:hypothetical protein